MEIMSNSNGYECDRGGDILSYMYNEGSTADRQAFELHLVDCTACTDEFAEVSLARYSVFEWQKEEFAHLPTPEFTIPFQARSTAGAGIFASILDLVAVSRWPAMAAAVLVLGVGIGLTAIAMLTGDSGQVAVTPNEIGVTASVQTGTSQVAAPVSNPAEQIETAEADTVNPLQPRIRNMKAVNTPRPRPNAEIAAKRSDQTNRKIDAASKDRDAAMASAPVLSNFEDTEDSSLRLADLLEGGGS